jgi:hypothetical protein
MNISIFKIEMFINVLKKGYLKLIYNSDSLFLVIRYVDQDLCIRNRRRKITVSNIKEVLYGFFF